MSSQDRCRTYSVLFQGRPTIRQIREELDNAAKSMNEYAEVQITTNGSSNPELEEITFTIETRH